MHILRDGVALLTGNFGTQTTGLADGPIFLDTCLDERSTTAKISELAFLFANDSPCNYFLAKIQLQRETTSTLPTQFDLPDRGSILPR